MAKAIVKNITDSLVYNVGYDPDAPQIGGAYLIYPDRPAVVDLDDPFIKRSLSENRLEVIPGKLPDSASDVEFQKYWAEDPKTAVDAYLTVGEDPKAAKPKGKDGK